jgi:hypothetical protein
VHNINKEENKKYGVKRTRRTNGWKKKRRNEVSTTFLSNCFHAYCSKKRLIFGDWKYVITGTSNPSLCGIMKLDKVGTSEVPSNSCLGRSVTLHAFHAHIETKLPSV